MDINELLHREQVSLLNAIRANCLSSRRAHEGLAKNYGLRLTAAGFPHRPSAATPARTSSPTLAELTAALS